MAGPLIVDGNLPHPAAGPTTGTAFRFNPKAAVYVLRLNPAAAEFVPWWLGNEFAYSANLREQGEIQQYSSNVAVEGEGTALEGRVQTSEYVRHRPAGAEIHCRWGTPQNCPYGSTCHYGHSGEVYYDSPHVLQQFVDGISLSAVIVGRDIPSLHAEMTDELNRRTLRPIISDSEMLQNRQRRRGRANRAHRSYSNGFVRGFTQAQRGRGDGSGRQRGRDGNFQEGLQSGADFWENVGSSTGLVVPPEDYALRGPPPAPPAGIDYPPPPPGLTGSQTHALYHNDGGVNLPPPQQQHVGPLAPFTSLPNYHSPDFQHHYNPFGGPSHGFQQYPPPNGPNSFGGPDHVQEFHQPQLQIPQNMHPHPLLYGGLPNPQLANFGSPSMPPPQIPNFLSLSPQQSRLQFAFPPHGGPLHEMAPDMLQQQYGGGDGQLPWAPLQNITNIMQSHENSGMLYRQPFQPEVNQQYTGHENYYGNNAGPCPNSGNLNMLPENAGHGFNNYHDRREFSGRPPVDHGQQGVVHVRHSAHPARGGY